MLKDRLIERGIAVSDDEWLEIDPTVRLQLKGDVKFLFQLIQCGDRNFAGVNFKDKEISCLREWIEDSRCRIQQLQMLELNQCDFSEADFRNCNLQLVSFRLSELPGALFTGARFERVNFQIANLRKASLRKCEIRGGRFNRVTLDEADLTQAKLQKVDLTLATLKYADLTKAQLEDANFTQANLSHANLTGANLKYANLAGANLTGANLTNAVLDLVDFRGTQIDGASIADRYRIVWEIVNRNAIDRDLSGADLSYADLMDVDLSGANLSGANLCGTNLNRCNLRNVNFTNANLSKAVLYDAHIQGAIFDRTNLKDMHPLPKVSSTSKNNDDLFLDIAKEVGNFCVALDHDFNTYDAKLWKQDDAHQFSFEELLRYNGHIRRIELDELCQEITDRDAPDSHRKYFLNAYQNAISYIKPHIETLEIYSFHNSRIDELRPPALILLLIAKTKSGEWLGISVESEFSHYDYKYDREFKIKDFAISRQENLKLLVAIEEAIDSFKNSIKEQAGDIYRQDRYIQESAWTLNQNRETTLLNLVLESKLVVISKYKDVPSIDDGDENKFNYPGEIFNFNPATSKLIADNFTNLRYYYIGNVEIDMYLTGQAKNGDWLTIGVSDIWA